MITISVKYNHHTNTNSQTSIAIHIYRSGPALDRDHVTQSAHDFAGLLSSVMMNGFPLLGLDDFILLSDAVNSRLGQEGRDSIMDYAGYVYEWIYIYIFLSHP